MNDLLPILSTLRRHKTAASLIVLEIALTFAIVCNALFLISQRYQALTRESGAPEAEMLVIQVIGKGSGGDADAKSTQDLAALRALPGVKAVTIENQTLYGGNHNSNSINLDPKQTHASLEGGYWTATEGFATVHGLKFVAGRDFLPEELDNGSAFENKARGGAMILNKAAAEKLFPGRSAIGQALYNGGELPSTVVGVVENLGPVSASRGSFEAEPYQMLDSERPSYQRGNYVLRVDEKRRDEILKAAVAAIQKVDGLRIIQRQKTALEMRAEYYAQDRAMIWLLGSVCVALLVVTAFGIVGLASFWVQQRTRMIGTRRALGASQAQILRYFQLENFLLSTIGIALGMAGAFGLSVLLMNSYELPRLPLFYLPLGALTLWFLGQLAVLAPARRAAALPPVAALRS